MPVAMEAVPCTRCMKPAYDVCRLCRTTRYCSEKCSFTHWPAHRHTCILICQPPGVSMLPGDGPAGIGNGAAPHQAAIPAVRVPASTPPAASRPIAATPPAASRPIAASPHAASRPSLSAPHPSGRRPPPNPAADYGARQLIGTETLSDKEFTKVHVMASSQPMELWVNVVRNASSVQRLHEQLAAVAAQDELKVCVPAVGSVYAGCYKGQWCRVRVLSVRPQLLVRYLDYGNDEFIGFSELRALQAEFLQLPAQAICIHFRGADQSKYDQYKMDDIIFIKCIENQADGTVLVEVEGEEAEAPLPQIPTQELPADTFTEVEILEPSQRSYWVTMTASSAALASQLTRMTQSAPASPALVHPRVGQLVAAKFSDEGWYRAKVVSVAPLKVLFVDFGNVTSTPVERLRPLAPEFHGLPAQAFQIRLKPDTPAHFRNLRTGARLRVNPQATGTDFVTVEVEDSVANTTPKAPVVASAAAAFTPEELPTDKFTPVTVGVSDAAGCLVSVNDNAEQTDNLTMELTELADSLQACQPNVGDAVAAIFCREWYRAVVTSVSPLKVFYVDYGNTETMNAEDIRKLPAQFTTQPAQAIKIALRSGSSTLDLQASASLRVRAVGKNGDTTLVEVEGDAHKPAAAAAALGDGLLPTPTQLPLLLPLPLPKLPVLPLPPSLPMLPAALAEETLPGGVFSPVVVVCLSGGLWVNLASSEAGLQEQALRLAGHFPRLPPVSDLAVGTMVAAVHKRVASRAQVRNVTGNGASLRFLDNGGNATMDARALRALPFEFLQLKAQAIEIQLADGTADKLVNLYDDACIMVKPIARAPSGALVVEVQADVPPSLQTIKPAVGTPLNVYFTTVGSADRYVQLHASAALLAEMDTEILAVVSDLPTARPVIGSLVLAAYNGEWARAVILTAAPSVQVRFVDFGNVATVGEESLRELSGKWAEIPAQALKVVFSADTPAAVAELTDFVLFLATFLTQAQDETWTIRGQIATAVAGTN